VVAADLEQRSVRIAKKLLDTLSLALRNVVEDWEAVFPTLSANPPGAHRLLRSETKAAKPFMKASSRALVLWSMISPSLSKAFSALDNMIRPSNQGAVPSVRNTGSHAVCASEVPPCPGVMPITATGLPPNTFWISSDGLESQSIAFFRTPGMELLYSGVTIKRPSAATILFFNSWTAGGIPSASSTLHRTEESHG
jgi:hypothetical protein